MTAHGGTGRGGKRHGTRAGAPRTLSPGLPVGGQLRFPPEKYTEPPCHLHTHPPPIKSEKI